MQEQTNYDFTEVMVGITLLILFKRRHAEDSNF